MPENGVRIAARGAVGGVRLHNQRTRFPRLFIRARVDDVQAAVARPVSRGEGQPPDLAGVVSRADVGLARPVAEDRDRIRVCFPDPLGEVLSESVHPTAQIEIRRTDQMDRATPAVVTWRAGVDRVQQQPVDPVRIAERERLITAVRCSPGVTSLLQT